MKTALFLGAGASVFAGQPTTKELIERVRERMKARGHKPHGDEGSQNYIMRVINNDTYSDVEKLHDGIDQMIASAKNANCVPIIDEASGDYNITHENIIKYLTDLRSTIREVLLDSFVIDKDARVSIARMYDMVRSVIKDDGTDGLQVFTTNYDMVMERYAYMKGFETINGFVDGSYRSGVWANAWNRRTDRPPLYLTKLHGSINWYEDADGDIVETSDVTQRDPKHDVLIVPTEGAKDYGRKPFPTLMERFRSEIEKVDVLLVIGFSYRDDEIVRIIRDRLENGMSLISVSPDAVVDIRRVDEVKPETTTVDGIDPVDIDLVGSGITLCGEKFGPDTINNVISSVETAYEFILQCDPRMHLKGLGAAP